MRTPPPVLPSHVEGQSKYQPTLAERLGPDSQLRLRARLTFILVFVISVPIFLGGMQLRGVHGWRAFATALVMGLLAATFAGWFPLRAARLAGDIAQAVTLPSGNSTPYEEQFSYQQSLAAKGDVAGALESYEALIAERPADLRVRLRAAELYAGKGVKPARAAELLREIRDAPGASTRDALYASSRLVDLYDGPLGEPGRALVELRRIIERFPTSREAEGARLALPRLKARLTSERASATDV